MADIVGFFDKPKDMQGMVIWITCRQRLVKHGIMFTADIVGRKACYCAVVLFWIRKTDEHIFVELYSRECWVEVGDK